MSCCSIWLLNLLFLLLANVRWVINAKYAACAWTIHIFSGNVSPPSLSLPPRLSLIYLFPWMWNNQLTVRPLLIMYGKCWASTCCSPPCPPCGVPLGENPNSQGYGRFWSFLNSHVPPRVVVTSVSCWCEPGCSQENLVWSITGWKLLQISLMCSDFYHGDSFYGWRWDRCSDDLSQPSPSLSLSHY